MNCKRCGATFTLKETHYYISLMCKCEIKIIYDSGKITIVPKTEYVKNKEVTKWD